MERILALHTAGFAAGIAAGVLLTIPAWLPLAAGLLLLLAALCWRSPDGRLLLLLFTCLTGMAWGQTAGTVSRSFPLPAEAAVAIDGRVASRPEDTPAGQRFILRVETVNGQPWPLRLKVQVLAEQEPGLAYGDRVQVSGQVLAEMPATNPHQFDYAAYLRRQGITATVSALYGGRVTLVSGRQGLLPLRLIFALRGRMDRALAALPPRQDRFIAGMLFGDKGSLDFHERSVLSETGLMDAFAVSGMHMGFVLLLALQLAAWFRLPLWPRLFLVSGVVLFYAAVTGFSASVVRSGLMALLGLWAYALDRQKDLLTALAAAALPILIVSPHALFDAGFQMSFAAAGGVLLLTPLFSPLLPLRPPWRDLAAASLAAQLSLAPLIAWYFNLLSPAGIVVGILVAWPVGWVIICGLVSLFLALFSVSLAALPLYAAGLITEGIWWVAEQAAGLPGSHFVLATPAAWLLLLYYGFLALLLYRPDAGPGRGVRLLAAVLGFCLLLLPAWPDHQLQVTFLDVGQGDCIFVQGPSGRRLLIDGGGLGKQEEDMVGQRIVIPFLHSHGIDRLDLLINTHPHDDHIRGLATVLANMRVGGVVMGANFSRHPAAKSLAGLAAKQKAPVFRVFSGQTIILEPGLVLEILYPPAGAGACAEEGENNGSLVLCLRYGQVDFLLTGDAERETLQVLNSSGFPLQAEVLKLSHHGSNDGFWPPFYQAVDPSLVMITVGRNSFGHPGAQVTDYWQQRGVPVYRTDLHGAVTVTSDGRTYQVRTEKGDDYGNVPGSALLP